VIGTFSLPGEGYRAAMDVQAADKGPVGFSIVYAASLDVFNHFLPVAEAMIKSIKLTSTDFSGDNQSTIAVNDTSTLPSLPDLPPLAARK
jgi:hypothetical protein